MKEAIYIQPANVYTENKPNVVPLLRGRAALGATELTENKPKGRDRICRRSIKKTPSAAGAELGCRPARSR